MLTISISKDEAKGEMLCKLLDYNKFNIKCLDEYCNDLYQKIQARNNLHKRISEFLSTDRAKENILTLIKEKFKAEGFDETSISDELSHMSLSVAYTNSYVQTVKIPAYDSIHQISDYSTRISNKDYTKYSFDKKMYYGKGRFVLELIKHYVKEHPELSYTELEQQFPQRLHSNLLGVVRRFDDIRSKIESHPEIQKRYFLRPNEIITLHDGTHVVVTNQWGDNFSKFLERAKQLYHINRQCNDQPTTQQHAKSVKIIFEDGSVIQETTVTETFRKFVTRVGAERIRTLGIRRNKIELISDHLDAKYEKSQKPVGHGLYLMTNTNTASKLRDIHTIATLLGIKITVETE